MIFAAAAFWIVLGVLVLAVALSGGPSGARGQLHAETKAARRTRLSAILLVCAFGIIVPVAVLVANGATKAKQGPAGLTLTASESRGQALFASRCSTCHTLKAAAAVGRVGPSLDARMVQVGTSSAARQAIVLAAIANGFARGNGQMPGGLYTGKDAQDVARYIAAVGGR